MEFFRKISTRQIRLNLEIFVVYVLDAVFYDSSYLQLQDSQCDGKPILYFLNMFLIQFIYVYIYILIREEKTVFLSNNIARTEYCEI